jgi:hypothetical protein
LLVRGTTELLSQFRTLATAPLEHGDKTYG